MAPGNSLWKGRHLINLFKVHMPESVIEPLRKTLLSGYIGQGPVAERFERELAILVGAPHVLTLNSGTSAIELALRLSDVGPGDEVVTTPMTCFATTAPILNRGALPVWADIDPMTGNVDPDSVLDRITKKTKAVIVVDWGGYACDLAQLKSICSSRRIPLIEDAAHAFGAFFNERPVGSWADMTAFSFQAIKTLTTGDGGALAILDKDRCRRGKLLRWYGIDREDKSRSDLRCENDITEAGMKWHMNDISAEIGLENLKYVAALLSKQRENAGFYREALQGLRRVKLMNYKRDRLSSYWLFTLLVDDRESFRKHMESCGVHTSQVHVRNDRHTATRAFQRPLPGVDEFSKRQVSIPVGWWVTKEDREAIVKAVREWDAS